MISSAFPPSLPPVIVDFWRWWTAELAGIARAFRPERRKSGNKVRILVEPARVSIERLTGDTGERFIEERPFEALDSDAFADIAELIGDTMPALILHAPDIFTTSLTLPKVAASRAVSAVALQMVELSPLRPDLLSWSIAERRVEGDSLHVRVVMAKTARIAALRERFAEHGLALPLVYAADGAGDVRLASAEDAGSPLFDWRGKRLWLIATALLATIPFTTLAGSAVLTARANNAVQALLPEVRERQASRREARQMEERRELLSPLAQQPGAATVLNALAKRLPPTDWLRQIERGPAGSLRFTVATSDEAALDTALRSEPLLPDVRVTMRTEGQGDLVDVDYESDAP